MVFPKYEDIQIPLLKVLIAAGGTATAKDAIKKVTSHFPDLTSKDLQAFQPSGRHLKWPNMVRWARQHLVDKGAIDGSVYGAGTITDTERAMVTAVEKGEPLPADRRPRRNQLRSTPTPPPQRTPVKREKLVEVLPLEKELYKRLRSTSQSGTDATVFEETLVLRFTNAYRVTRP